MAMTGKTAQIAALTCHLNARLRHIPVDRDFADNLTSRSCEFIRFVQRTSSLETPGNLPEVIESADAWIDAIEKAGASAAKIAFEHASLALSSDWASERMLGGGARWFIVVQNVSDFRAWEPFWRTRKRETPESRIWRVQYDEVDPPTVPENSDDTVDCLFNLLGQELLLVESFARSHGLRSSAASFAQARECLSADDPMSLVYFRDIVPLGTLTLAASRLLASCQAASIFGGLWSEPDLTGAEYVQYRRVSDRFYDVLNRSICAAANSTCAGH
jgi:hypothetical protein